MSVFFELCKTARGRGVTRIDFSVDLTKFVDKATIPGAGPDDCWECVMVNERLSTDAVTYGRTGEEALRAGVDSFAGPHEGKGPNAAT